MEQLSSLDKFKSYIAGLGGNTVQKDDAIFICTGGPLSPTWIEIPRYRPDLIAEHKQSCDKCVQTEKERREQHERDLDTEMRMQGCQMLIDKARLEIACYEDRKKAMEEKRAKGQELDYDEKEKLRLAEYDAGVALETIRRETIELQRLKEKEKEESY